MSISSDLQASQSVGSDDGAPPPSRSASRWRRAWIAAATALAAIGLFFAYRRMAWAHPINADGASNALQAWDMWHGNPLMSGWTLSDVSFYSTELIQYMMIQVVVGLNPEMIRIAAAMTYTLMILVVAALAKGRATGKEAAVRVGVALAIMLFPAPGIGYMTLFSSPNHTGSGVPMVITWLVLDRALTAHREPRRWLPVAIALLLAWGEIGDPLVTFVGALPLVLVSAIRVIRAGVPWRQRWRGIDAQLLVAGAGSVVIAHAFLFGVRALGGFHAPAPPISLAPIDALPDRASMVVKMIGAVFGVYREDGHPGAGWVGLALLHAVGIVLVLVALVAVFIRGIRGTGDRINEILTLAICINVGAEVVSTLPSDILATREIVAVLPLGAALAARVCAPRLLAWRLAPALAGVLVVLTTALVVYSPPRSAPAENQDIAEWLDSRGLHYGLGSYWSASNITVTTRQNVVVVPIAGGDRVTPYCWQSRNDWYDKTAHDARFVIFDRERSMYGTREFAEKQFGAPVEFKDFGRHVVLVYDYNVLEKMPAPCT
jgi:hypothetical protein